MVQFKGVLALAKDWRRSLWRLRWWTARVVVPRRSVNSRGLGFTLQCDNWITHYRWQSYNAKEPETLNWIDTWVGDGGTFFDIGANIGVYTIYAALRHTGTRIVAFEPEYANLHLLKDNIIANGLQDKIEVYSIALSNCSNISHLHIQDLTPGSACHSESKGILKETLTGYPVLWREGIYTLTVDKFCEETGFRANYIKIDVDGTEPEVLEGATQTLRSRDLRSLLLELPTENKAREACERLLSVAGLRRQWRDPHAKSPNEIWVRDSA